MAAADNVYLAVILLLVFEKIAGQQWNYVDYDGVTRNKTTIIWCNVNKQEQQKCRNFAMAIERDDISVGYEYFRLECKFAFNKDECMALIDEEKATLTTVDPGEVFVGGRFHSLVPIAQEVSDGGFNYVYSVAVIKKGSLHGVTSIRDLRGKRACFAGVGLMAGWVLPVYTMMKEGGMEIIDCNNHVKSATNFFGPSCAVNALTDKYNPIGDNSDKLCSICIGPIPGGRCTGADPYAGYEGAFRCLLEAGDIAFLKHNTVDDLISGLEFSAVPKDHFELLCKDGSRAPISDYRSCNWGTVPSNAVVTSSATVWDVRVKLQKFLNKVAERYSTASNWTSEGNRTGFDNFNNRNFDDINNRNLYDQFGNRIRNKRQTFHQFGNRIRNKRQTFDQFGNKNDNPGQSGQNDPYSRDNFNRDQNRDGLNRDPNSDLNRDAFNRDQFNRDQSNRDQFNRDQFNRDQFNRDPSNTDNRDSFNRDSFNRDQFDRDSFNRDPFNRNPTDRPRQNDPINQDLFGDRPRPIDPYSRDTVVNERDPYANDPFRGDPYFINRDQYGENIDPYNVDFGVSTRDRERRLNRTRIDTSLARNGTNNTFYEVFNLFESSPRYGIYHNLMFQDSTRRFKALSENQQTYSGFLGKSLDLIMGTRECPVGKMTLCVTSDVELEKCIKMRTALKAQLLKPEMVCYKAHSQINCMQSINSGNADVAVFDASDVYTSGLQYDLVPFISEVYNLGEPEYYVVAVAKEEDPSTELTYLKGKNTCHGGINTAAGWVYPLAYLISNGWIRPYGCNSIRAGAEYFTKSCVPGALSTEYNTGVPYDNMCDLCHGTSFRYCRRDASEDYYGHTGAFRCLVEGGGHVAFVKHTTVSENTGGKRREWWARDALIDDFELLCPDGTRAEIQDYKKCNLGKVKANAIVTRGGYGYNETQINAYINLFLYSQTFYGRKQYDEFSFSMFDSIPPFTDLIFQDATTQLKVIPSEQRRYSDYLGPDYMRARRIVDCHAGAGHVQASILFATVLPLMIASLLTRC